MSTSRCTLPAELGNGLEAGARLLVVELDLAVAQAGAAEDPVGLRDEQLRRRLVEVGSATR